MANTKIPVELSSTPGIADSSNATAITIDSSENVGIANTSPVSKLDVTHTITANTGDSIASFGTSGSGGWANSAHQVIIGGPSLSTYTGLIIFSDSTSGNGQLSFADGKGASDSWRGSVSYNHANDFMKFDTNANEVMRFTSAGKILMNHTSSISDETLQVRNNQSTGYGILVDELGSGGGTFMRFRVNGSIVGQIYGNGSATTYATSSDATLKDVTGKARGLEVINELNPVSFTWKKTGVSDEGFIAQEVDKIIPSVVHKDAEDMYSMDYGKVTPYLVKAIQEQQEQIEALQSEINTLKGG